MAAPQPGGPQGALLAHFGIRAIIPSAAMAATAPNREAGHGRNLETACLCHSLSLLNRNSCLPRHGRLVVPLDISHADSVRTEREIAHLARTALQCGIDLREVCVDPGRAGQDEDELLRLARMLDPYAIGMIADEAAMRNPEIWADASACPRIMRIHARYLRGMAPGNANLVLLRGLAERLRAKGIATLCAGIATAGELAAAIEAEFDLLEGPVIALPAPLPASFPETAAIPQLLQVAHARESAHHGWPVPAARPGSRQAATGLNRPAASLSPGRPLNRTG